MTQPRDYTVSSRLNRRKLTRAKAARLGFAAALESPDVAGSEVSANEFSSSLPGFLRDVLHARIL
jgi:hypothetical protein